jgi:hypothetical protein
LQSKITRKTKDLIDLNSEMFVINLPHNTDWFTDTTGTGSVAVSIIGQALFTGNTLGSESASSYHVSSPKGFGINYSSFNLNTKNIFSFLGGTFSNLTDGVVNIKLGIGVRNGGELDATGFGLKIDNYNLYGLIHDGTTLQEIDLNYTIEHRIAYKFDIVFGNNKIEWYVNNERLLSTDLNLSSFQGDITFGIRNTSATECDFRFNSPKLINGGS